TGSRGAPATGRGCVRSASGRRRRASRDRAAPDRAGDGASPPAPRRRSRPRPCGTRGRRASCAAGGGSAARPRRSGWWRRRRSYREAYNEFRAALVAAVARGDQAALGLDEALGDGKAEPGAGRALVALGAVELVEQPVYRLARNARPLVAYDELDPGARRLHLDLDAAAGRRILA